MQIENTEIEYHIDHEQKKLHLLDLDQSGRKSLTNAIGNAFIMSLIEQEHLPLEVFKYEWICYASDGIVASYEGYNFNFKHHSLPYLHKEYLEVMEDRKKMFR